MNRRTRNSTRWITASALALALPLLAACRRDTEQSPTPSESTPPTPSETATPTETERDPLTPPTFEEPHERGTSSRRRQSSSHCVQRVPSRDREFARRNCPRTVPWW